MSSVPAPPTPLADIKTLISEKDIAKRVAELAEMIAEDFPGDMMIVSLLRGSFVFTSDLIRALHHAGCHPQVSFMTLGSYGKGTESSGTVKLMRDLIESVEGRSILIVDDILESGRTLHFTRELMLERKANSVRIAVLLEKPGKRKRDIKADYVGFVVEDKFVVGYGLDYADFYRELPFIGYVP